MQRVLPPTIFKSFDDHIVQLEAARERRREVLAFKSALEDGGDDGGGVADLDTLDGLGVWMPGDKMQGTVNMRTLQKLLTRVDQRGFERCALANPCALHHFAVP